MSDKSFQRGSILACRWRINDIFSVVKPLHNSTYLMFVDYPLLIMDRVENAFYFDRPRGRCIPNYFQVMVRPPISDYRAWLSRLQY